MDSIIIRFRYEHLRNEVHVECHESVDNVFVKHAPALLGIAPQYEQYKSQLGVEISVLDVISKSEHTAALEEQDHKRDRLFRGFGDAVKSGLNHFAPAKQDAARKLQSILDHYGNIAAKPLDQETAALDDLLRELAMPNHAALIATLGLEDWLVELNTENQAFKTLIMERYAETALRPTTRMKSARAAVDKTFREMVDRIEALVMVNGAASYEAFIRELNAVLERYKNMLAQRQGRAKKSSETTSNE
jgi:hypothetical protein